MFSAQITTILATIAVTSFGQVNAGAITLSPRSLIPSWSCPGPNERQANFDIKTDDMQPPATAVQQNSLTSGHLDDQILIKASHGYLIKAGTVQVLAEPPWDTMKGDTGLKAIVTVGKAGDPCKGATDVSDYLSTAEFAFKTGKFFWDVFSPLITGHP
ncbi:hypothetical protein P171DRAFT_482048 [Karstenula rhodostoma CBS 690.94]|uniref:Uncharacterized protein n=1 Tax=Karstenula rhodostoma CBS 690.94 TaxID=1392251 RepID=A0A9P4PTJ1_9PLEO|nr:hypothetical protein P171DRAFT_482048 [Karstenula rhodostoma CBS 690.94]